MHGQGTGRRLGHGSVAAVVLATRQLMVANGRGLQHKDHACDVLAGAVARTRESASSPLVSFG